MAKMALVLGHVARQMDAAKKGLRWSGWDLSGVLVEKRGSEKRMVCQCLVKDLDLLEMRKVHVTKAEAKWRKVNEAVKTFPPIKPFSSFEKTDAFASYFNQTGAKFLAMNFEMNPSEIDAYSVPLSMCLSAAAKTFMAPAALVTSGSVKLRPRAAVGSLDLGPTEAEKWQKIVIKELMKVPGASLISAVDYSI